jgi:hypothetical protein
MRCHQGKRRQSALVSPREQDCASTSSLGPRTAPKSSRQAHAGFGTANSRRTPSSCCDILVLRLAHHLVAKVAAQRPGCVQIDPASQNTGQLFLEVEEGEAGYVTGFELHEYIHVAFCGKVCAQDGPEQGEPPDVVTTAEVSDALSIHGYSGYHRANRIRTAV